MNNVAKKDTKKNKKNHEKPSYIVGLGASAGGLEALESFFKGIAVDTGMAFVVIQHLAPDFKSLMDELLARCTTMAIHKSENNMKIEPNSIYLIPPKKEMIIENGALILRDRNEKLTPGNLNLPINTFFESLALDYKNNAISIVLSGTGSDGTKGIMAVHEEGGLVLCQSADSAAFDGMPNSAIATSIVDIITTPSEMPEILVEYISNSQTFLKNRDVKILGGQADVYTPIFQKLQYAYGVDFHIYKPGTISRRIERRMTLTRQLTVNDYVDHLRTDETELELLYRDLLIGVTQFFRDPEYWAYITNSILPGVCEQCSSEKEVRFWIAGCASGEEPYSLAILVHEHLTSVGKPVNVRMFATDLHKDSLSFASKGVYSANSVSAIPEKRRTRYFTKLDNGNYEVSPEIRRMVVFAQHNVFKDPPFTKIDFLSCRNLLIYFLNDAQKRILGLFHFALKVKGTLFLGPSETLGDLESEFDELHRRFKVYKKRREIKLRNNASSIQSAMTQSGDILLREPVSRNSTVGGRDINIIRAYDILLQQHVPSSILVESNGNLAYTFGAATDYLQNPPGASTLDVLELIHPALRTALSTGLQRTAKESKAISYGGIKVELNDEETRIIKVIIKPISDLKPSDFLLVSFEQQNQLKTIKEVTPIEVIPKEDIVDLAANQISNEHIKQLEEELVHTKENLQATVEELETSNEELQATNEELMASNEELQSTNEELHSVNEELYTVNREYEEKIEQLTQLNEDMDNLLAATKIGTIFLDKNFKIREFTPAAAKQFSLLTQDIGRPISHLNRHIEFDDFHNVLEKVRETGVAFTKEVRNLDNRWYLMGVHPYLSEANETTGVVVTFVDINLIKEVSHQISQRNEDLQSFAYAVSHDFNEPIRILSSFSKLLIRDTGPHDKKDENIQMVIEQIKSASDQLQQMLEGTLHFSRIVSQGENFDSVDLNKSIKEAKLKLKGELQDVSAKVFCEELPTIKGDASQMTRIFTELLTNSLKFQTPGVPPLIDITCEVNKAELTIKYIDNGIGVNIEEPEKIFNLFYNQKNGKTEKGKGLGLTICKRIIERHRGTIIYSSLDTGSQFNIKLPFKST